MALIRRREEVSEQNARPVKPTQYALPLEAIDPLEPRNLPKWGWWTLSWRSGGGGKLIQKPYRLDNLEFILARLDRNQDTYMSQGFFTAPNRRAVNLAYLTHAWIDVDFYNSAYRAYWPCQVVNGLLDRCRDEGIPLPSVIMSSGRGMYLKWFWKAAIPRAAAGRAIAVNRALIRLFAEYGADPVAYDVSRILRVAGTVNTKSGTQARVVWQNDDGDGGVVSYDFDTFADEVLPFTLEQIREFRANAKAKSADVRILSQERIRREHLRSVEDRRKTGRKAFAKEEWHWGVIEDIRQLATRRWGDDGVPAGKRDLFGFLTACQLAQLISPKQLSYEITALAGLMMPHAYAAGDLKSQCSSLMALARSDAAGGSPDGRTAYKYKKETLIGLLQIEQDEMRSMTRLIDDDEKRRRDREAWRRDHSGMTRDQYEAGADARAAQAAALRATGLTWQAVAAEMGLGSRQAAERLASRATARENG